MLSTNNLILSSTKLDLGYSPLFQKPPVVPSAQLPGETSPQAKGN